MTNKVLKRRAKQRGYFSVLVGTEGKRFCCSAKDKVWLIKNAETQIMTQVDLAKMTKVEKNSLLNEIRKEVRLLAEEV